MTTDSHTHLLPGAHAGTAAALDASILEIRRRLTDDRMTVITGCTVHPDDVDAVRDLRAEIGASPHGACDRH